MNALVGIDVTSINAASTLLDHTAVNVTLATQAQVKDVWVCIINIIKHIPMWLCLLINHE